MDKRDIRLYFAAADGWRARYRYQSLSAAQRGAQKRVGESPEVGSTGYAVSSDGVVTVRADGASFEELFPKIAAELAWQRSEEIAFAAAQRERDEYVKNYRLCEHGMDAALCGGPMHWYDDERGEQW